MSESAAERPRVSLFRRLYNWILQNAEGPYAYAILAGVAFAEASFFPILPDVVMAPMILANRGRAFQVTFWCIVWSVVGSVFGYSLGSVFYSAVGHWLVALMGVATEIDALRDRFAHNSWIIVVVGLFTPYKLVSISSGIAGVPLALFIFYSTISRAIRFGASGALLYTFGNPVRAFLEKRLEQVMIGFFALVVLIIVGFRFVVHLF
jgi:membrane protein YqaA with SNARE-associated domain